MIFQNSLTYSTVIPLLIWRFTAKSLATLTHKSAALDDEFIPLALPPTLLRLLIFALLLPTCFPALVLKLFRWLALKFGRDCGKT